jgi:putative GTP pyrophosphokinase
MNRSALDRLGERLRGELHATDLTLLDSHRRSFAPTYDGVVDRIRSELGLEISGRPAKSTTAIVDKLRRSSMRLTQMQDIAGCRIVLSDIKSQDQLVAALGQMYEVVIFDRRLKPTHGYRAVHVVIRHETFPVEVQVRTELQHAWAEFSEKVADGFGIQVKYGQGPAHIQKLLKSTSNLGAILENEFERLLPGDELVTNARLALGRLMVRLANQYTLLK